MTPNDVSSIDPIWDAYAARYDCEFLWSLWARAWGEEYPVDVRPYSSCTRTLLQQLVRQTALSPGDVVVDVGCGIGGVVLWLAREFPLRAVGVDWSGRAIEIARDRAEQWTLRGSAEFVRGRFANTGLPSNSAHAVVSIDALPFAPDADAAFAELQRILQPGGHLVYTTRGRMVDGVLQVGERSEKALAKAGFKVACITARPEVSSLWRTLSTEWLAHEERLRAELPPATANSMLAEARTVDPTLDDGRPWLLVTATR